ncbi:1-phosphofructokinase [Anaerostipes sp.]|uniref:1-phosphofructokinase n=1 Tax=Anaerostipes sp. TaxID=1872530 RepID=UPI0025C7097F|nr:1-phosphofructokinase [Anaerostipes sp.]MBS7007814.1 1-phosphofructokinase [Anaerostipes sp.]
MIITVTLNVSVDKAYKIKGSVRPGTVSRVEECRNTAGGKGLNVARIVDLCGGNAAAAGFAGGFNGSYVKKMLEEDGIKSRFTEVKGETRSCINILAEDGTSTEYLEPGAPVDQEEWERFLQDFESLLSKSEVVTISGSIPKGLRKDCYRDLIREVRSRGKQVILDTSGEYLKEGIKEGPTMIKPNQEELSALLGIQIRTREELIKAGKKLRDQGIPYVVISLGAEGALMICEDGVYHGKPPKLKALNPVGCGDSMVGAFAVAFSQNKPAHKALAFAVAVSAANAMNPGTGKFRKEDLQEILPGVKVEKIED